MKRILAITLSLLIILTVSMPAFAITGADYNVPTILIRGDGSDLADAEGNIIWPKQIGDEDGDGQEIIDAVIEVLLPYFPMGLISDNWEPYYDKFEEVMLGFFGDTALDGNGNPVTVGSGLSDYYKNLNATEPKTIRKSGGRYVYNAYQYNYDFRLSPYDYMEDLDNYIMTVMETTGAKKVNLAGRCLGGGPLLCYLDYYLKKVENGATPYVKNVMFQAVTANGCDPLTSAFSGNMRFDSLALERFMDEYVDKDSDSIGDILDTAPFINELILTSYDFLREVGVVDSALIGTADALYAKLAGGLTPRLLKALFGTWAGYWTAIDTEYFTEAINLVFGKEGTAEREEYAGLVSKIEKYYNEVATKKEEIFTGCENLGVHFGAYVKYGNQLFPFVENPDVLGDSLVSVEDSSFGATTALIGETLSKSYIDERTALGYGDYISNDMMIDLSTARFKDSTWVVKNLHHESWTPDAAVVNNFLWGTNCTTNNDKAFPRFMVYNEETEHLEAMTDENCGVTQWDELENTGESTLKTKLAAFIRWFTSIFKLLTNLFKK